MLNTPAEFPHPGSRAFVRGTAERVTIVRRNQDGTALLRREPNPGELRNRDASGNTTLPLADLYGDVIDDGNALIALGNLVEGDGHRPSMLPGMTGPASVPAGYK